MQNIPINNINKNKDIKLKSFDLEDINIDDLLKKYLKFIQYNDDIQQFGSVKSFLVINKEINNYKLVYAREAEKMLSQGNIVYDLYFLFRNITDFLFLFLIDFDENQHYRRDQKIQLGYYKDENNFIIEEEFLINIVIDTGAPCTNISGLALNDYKFKNNKINEEIINLTKNKKVVKDILNFSLRMIVNNYSLTVGRIDFTGRHGKNSLFGLNFIHCFTLKILEGGGLILK